MIQVDVYSRFQAEGLDPRPGTAVISISNPGSPPVNLKEGWEAILRLQFDDVVRPVSGIPDLILFGEQHVRAIQDFLKENHGKDFVIHCEAGVSRSVAIGLYLQDAHEAKLTTYAIHTTTGANARVHSGLMRDHWIKRLGAEKEE